MTSIAYAALWLFVFVLPFEGVVRIDKTAILSQATGMIAMGFAVFAVLSSGRLRRLHILHVAALLFVLTAAFDLLAFHDLGLRPPSKFLTYVQLLLMLWMIWELAPSEAGCSTCFSPTF